jgi:rhodanese-related sulfurtransferase
MASHEAAREAAKLGYKNLFVMTDGISGWVKAGKPVETGGT